MSIVGQYHVLGPVHEPDGSAANRPGIAAVDLDATVDDGQGRKLSWRRVNANAEGMVDLSALVAGDAKSDAWPTSYAPLVSPVAQEARLVLDTPAEAAGWVNGKPVTFSATGEGQGRAAIRQARPRPRGPGRC